MVVPRAVTLMMKKGISCDPGVGSPETTAHMRPPKKGPRALTPLARVWAVPFTAPRFDGGANLFTIACACEITLSLAEKQQCKNYPKPKKQRPSLPSSSALFVCSFSKVHTLTAVCTTQSRAGQL